MSDVKLIAADETSMAFWLMHLLLGIVLFQMLLYGMHERHPAIVTEQ